MSSSLKNIIPQVKIEDLFQAGVHFGHRTSSWNPKMSPYIYGERSGTHIIDLRQTAGLMQLALEYLYGVIANNGRVLFVGYSPLVAECAKSCGQYYVSHRWLGGTLTNWNTVSKSIKRLEELEEMLSDQEEMDTYTKRQILSITTKKEKLATYIDGIRNMGGIPDVVVMLCTRKEHTNKKKGHRSSSREHLAIKEAKKLGIKVVGIVDTNCNPDDIDYVVPGNDDANRAIQYYCDMFSSVGLLAIEESLRKSGVDIEDVSSEEMKKSDLKKIVKYTNKEKPTSKFSKAIDESLIKEEDINFENNSNNKV